MFAFARQMMRFSVAAVASATGLLAHEPPPQQPRDAPAVAGQALEPAAALRQQYESYWKLESKRLVKLLDLSPDDATILSEKVVSALAELAAEMVTIGMGQTFGLDVDQMKSLTRLVESNLPKPMSGLKFSHGFYKAILNIPLDEILAIVGDENMPAWKSQMDQGRRLLEQTKNEQEHDNG